MDKIINEMIEMGLGNIINKITDIGLGKDEIYLKSLQDAEELKMEIEKLGLLDEQSELLEDFEGCLMSASSRACEIAYLVGIKNTILFLKGIDVFKTTSEE